MDSATVKLKLARGASVSTDRMLTEDDSVRRGLDREDPKVEELVVQRAQRKAVGLDVGPAHVVPLDVRRFEACGCMSDAQVETADTASVFVGAQHTLPKGGIASPTFGGGVLGINRHAISERCGPIEIQAEGRRNIGMQGAWEAGIEYACRHGL